MYASFYNHTEVVEFLVQEGANIKLKNKHGSHAAYNAAQDAWDDWVVVLLHTYEV